MADPLDWIGDELERLRDRGLLRNLAVRESPQRPALVRIDGRELINFSSNDYLGLAADAALTSAVRESLEAHGWGAGASPLVTGHGSLHARLEQELALFEGVEAALLFSTGFAANVGAVTALAEKEDVIFSDAKNHASLIDGCRLSGAKVCVYRHADAPHLASLLMESRSFRRRLIVTDSLFSMDGDLAPLADLASLAEQHNAMLLVDEAHATGVFGETGRGVCEHLGVEDGVHLRVGTLSKALGSAGGFVVGRATLIQWLANRARPYVFSTAMPEALSAAALAALQIVRDEPHRRRAPLERAKFVRERLVAGGWTIGNSQSQIIPLYLGQPEMTMRLSAALRERGLIVPGIRPPSVPAGESLLRLSVSYGHDWPILERALSAITSIAGADL